MTYKVGFSGAPGSGKTTFASMLYAELLQRGISAKIVSEYAQEHIGYFNLSKLTPEDQRFITHKQVEREAWLENCQFDVLICDSAVWLGHVYDKHYNGDNYLPSLSQIARKHFYDLEVYVSLPEKNYPNDPKHRIENFSEAKKINRAIQQHLMNRGTTVFYVPTDYDHRVEAAKMAADTIIEELERKKRHPTPTPNLRP